MENFSDEDREFLATVQKKLGDDIGDYNAAIQACLKANDMRGAANYILLRDLLPSAQSQWVEQRLGIMKDFMGFLNGTAPEILAFAARSNLGQQLDMALQMAACLTFLRGWQCGEE
jgi:hypothetical protein